MTERAGLEVDTLTIRIPMRLQRRRGRKAMPPQSHVHPRPAFLEFHIARDDPVVLRDSCATTTTSGVLHLAGLNHSAEYPLQLLTQNLVRHPRAASLDEAPKIP